MKILMSAYSCEPGQGSERGLGWDVVQTVAKNHEVWVLTRPDEGKEAIEVELARNPQLKNLHFLYFTLPIIGGAWKWGFGLMQLHYYLWQIQAYFVARRLHRQVNFDVVHHVTFVKYSRPSFLALLPIPFIWGPVGGGEFAPRIFWKEFSLSNKIHEIVRLLACWIFEVDPFVRLTARRSNLVLATTEETALRLRKIGVKNVSVYSQLGLTDREITEQSQLPISVDLTIRFISIGRLLHWKGFHLGLRAFACSALPETEYWIIGDGPERQRLQNLTKQLGISHQVKFLGSLPRKQISEKLRQCKVLVHPSLHDSGGGVCLEAMVAGLPVLCLDLGGPAVQVTEQTGFKIIAQTPEQVVQDLSEAMVCLAQNDQLRINQGLAGQKRVNKVFNWDVKGQLFTEIYQKLVMQSQFRE